MNEIIIVQLNVRWSRGRKEYVLVTQQTNVYRVIILQDFISLIDLGDSRNNNISSGTRGGVNANGCMYRALPVYGPFP